MRARHRSLPWLPLVFALISCGGGGGDGPTTPTPITPTASAIAAASGNSQTGKAEAALSAPLVVKVSSAQGAGISGITVTFAATSGSVNPTSGTTDANGNAQTVWTLGSSIGAQSASATAAGLSGSPVSFTATAGSAWTLDATIFTNASSFGGTAGNLANVTVLKLTDGRYRMIIGAVPGSADKRSAISTDGVAFTLESGVRLSCPQSSTEPCFGQPFIMRLDDGRTRLFAELVRIAPGFEEGIYSFTSTDEGLTFTRDAGVRIVAAAAGMQRTHGPSIVKVQTGGWRMYFSDNTTGPTSPRKILSAFSTDLVTWTIDPGVRIGAGSTLTGSAEHPGSIANADGSVTLVYAGRGQPNPMYYSTSPDGLNFPREALMGLPRQTGFEIEGNDPFLLHLGNGDVRMYYGVGDPNSGMILTARRAPFRVNTP